jgi:uncharacterized protein
MTTCWGITDGSAGMAVQVRALAAALDLKPEMKKVLLKKPFAWLPNVFFTGPLRRLVVPLLIGRGSDPLKPPYPDLVISCGRRAAIVAMGLRSRASRQTRFIHILDPHVKPKHFDLIIAMEHDRIMGTNVLKTPFALHGITPEMLTNARERFLSSFMAYPKPYVTVLLGGTTNKYKLTRARMLEVIAALRRLLGTRGSLLITPSRRTGEENIAMLRQAFAGNPRVYIYDLESENPYLGLLAMADFIVVSNDSVNMMSEAHATDKPLYILPLPGHKNSKPARFAESMIRDGMARPLGDSLERWSVASGYDMMRLANLVRERLAGL